MKNPGTACNIGCIYCAEARKDYTSVKEKIEYNQVEKIAQHTKEYSLNILFHGGEPTLLSIDYYEKVMEIFEKYNSDIYFGIQTNATLINKEWIEFFIKNKKKLGVSVSLDGPQPVNSYRVFKNGNETFDTVYNNLKLMEDNGIKTGMICTIVKKSLGNEKKILDMLLEFSNILFVKLNPCFDIDDFAKVPEWGITPKEYTTFVKNFFLEMFKKGIWDNFLVEPIISILKNIQGCSSSFCNYSFNKCSNFISVYPDGSITSCDNYNFEEGYLGTILDLSNTSSQIILKKNKSLFSIYKNLMEECRDCNYLNICKGGCIAVRIRYKESDEYCLAMKDLIDYIRKVFADFYEHC